MTTRTIRLRPPSKGWSCLWAFRGAVFCVLCERPPPPPFPTPCGCFRFTLDPSCSATRVAFVNYKGVLDGGVLVTLSDGRVQILDPEDGDVLQEEEAHTKEVKRISFNREKTLVFTASADCTAKMLDAETLEVLKVYETDRPVNAIVQHPTKDHVLLGGGQDAMSVTTTSGKVGKFECRFFEMVYNEEIGRVKVRLSCATA